MPLQMALETRRPKFMTMALNGMHVRTVGNNVSNTDSIPCLLDQFQVHNY